MAERDLPDDRDLLLGVLALQTGFIDADQLVDALTERARDRSRTLSQILEDAGVLAASRRALLEPLVVEHLRQHGGDPPGILTSLRVEALLCDLDAWADREAETMRAGPPRAGRSLAATRATGSTEVAGRGPVSTTIARAAWPSSPTPPSPGPSRPPGSRFRILRPHGRGGLGQVSEARDEELGRIVALKEMQPRLADDPSHRARFVLEAEINGNLEHPGIVPVYGFGIDPDGRPYYAMRLVRGESLQAALEAFHRDSAAMDATDRSLRLRGLLGRFLVVCEAMAYSHSRGVLHRDLKPSNIMLGRYGETQIIDWGLAKATGHPDPASSPGVAEDEAILIPSSGSSIDPTIAGSALGTPQFMSPEQAEGKTATLGVATDIYGLGATLYAVLTGRPPVQGRDRKDVLSRVRRGEIPPPRSIVPDLPRPLEAICLKAMALRPEDRYGSALGLADDLRRWMADEPVSALRDRALDRLARWERRHRALIRDASVASVLIAVVSLAAVALTLRAWETTAESRDIAEDERERAEGRFRTLHRIVGDFLDPLADDLYLVPGSAETRRALARTNVAHHREYLADDPDDPDRRHRAIRSLRVAANIERMLGADEGAGALYGEALALLDEAPDPTLHAWVLIDRAQWHEMNGRLDAAIADSEEVAGILEAIAGDRDDATPTRLRAVAALDRSGIAFARGAFDEAAAAAEEARDRFEQIVRSGDAGALDRVLEVSALVNRAAALRESGRLGEAREAIGLASRRANTLCNQYALDPHTAIVQAAALREWARLRLDDPDSRDAAIAAINRAVVVHASLFNQYGEVVLIRLMLAEAFNDRAEVVLALGMTDAAEADARRAIDRIDLAAVELRGRPSAWRERGRALEVQSIAARLRGDEDAARRLLDEARAAFEHAVRLDPARFLDRRDADRLRDETRAAPPAVAVEGAG